MAGRQKVKLKSLSKDDMVRIADPNVWNRKATVVQEVGPRSDAVRSEENQILRRNRRSC